MRYGSFTVAVLALLLSGCASGPTEPSYEAAADSRLIGANYDAADRLLASLRQPIGPDAPIIVATLVDVDNLNRSSRLGRLLSDQLGARLVQNGYKVLEVKLAGDLFVRSGQGELMLSRELAHISSAHQARAVLVGTYADAGDYVYISLELVSATDNVILGAASYALPINGIVRSMLPADRL